MLCFLEKTLEDDGATDGKSLYPESSCEWKDGPQTLNYVGGN